MARKNTRLFSIVSVCCLFYSFYPSWSCEELVLTCTEQNCDVFLDGVLMIFCAVTTMFRWRWVSPFPAHAPSPSVCEARRCARCRFVRLDVHVWCGECVCVCGEFVCLAVRAGVRWV